MEAMSTAEPSERPQAYQLVLDHIESGILEHRLKVGEQLPPERDLAAQLGVSRSAVREAMRVLQTQGLITSGTGPGRGTRIAPSQGDALGRIFRLHLTLSEDRIADLTEVRVALERASAALAAGLADDRATAELHSLLAAMAETREIETFNSLDTDFHVQIARAGSNLLIGDLTAAIREAAKEPLRAASLAMPNWQDFREHLHEQHRGILAAITARAPERASELMEAHIRDAYAALGITSAPAVAD